MMRDAPLDDGWLEMQCELCGMAVTLGPRQRSMWELDPDVILVLDFLCAVKVSKGQGSLQHMGGG